MFENIEEDIKKYDTNDQPLISLGNNVYLLDSNFQQKLAEIDSMPDSEIDAFVKVSYPTILYKIANKIDLSYLKGFTTVKFLTALEKILREDYNNTLFSQDYKIYFNSIAYDYLSFKKSQRDENIATLLFNISRLLNRNTINILLGAGISESIASYIALSYHSSMDDKIIIPRVNFVLLHENPQVMTTQRIVNIYERLYNNLIPLFLYTLCDVVEIDENVPNYESKRMIYEAEADAVVAILNNMPSNMIHGVLIAFYEYCVYNNYLIANIRYSLRALPVDDNNNSRVLNMIDQIYNLEGKFIL